MANDVEITVRVNNQAAAGLNSVNQAVGNLRTRAAAAGQALGTLATRAEAAKAALNNLKDAAQNANQELGTLRGRAAATAAAMGELRQHGSAASQSLGTLGQRAETAHERMNDLVDRTTHLRDAMHELGDGGRDAGDGLSGLRGRIGDLSESANRASSAVGAGGASGGIGLVAALKGIGIAVGTVASPALGALVPMLAGAATAGFTAKLAFSGVGDAVEQAGKDQQKYHELLGKMGPEQREFTKTLVAAKDGFSKFGKEIQKAALPSFTAALKGAKPAFDTVKDGMRGMAGALGRIAVEFGKLFGSGEFRKALSENLSMGTQFFETTVKSLAPFTQALLDFGAASRPTLDAFGQGISDLFSKGLPGFFDGLQTGIGGAAAVFRGFFGMVNELLPKVGSLLGAVADAVGPLFEQLFEAVGQRGAAAMDVLTAAVKALKPIFKDLGYAVSAANELFGIFWGVAKDVGGAITDALLPAFGRIDEARGPFRRLADAIHANRDAIKAGAQAFGGFVLDMVTAAVENLPLIVGGFREMVQGVLMTMGGLIHGAAIAFGWVPGVGDKLKAADRAFSGFARGALSGLASVEKGAQHFSDVVGPRLRGNKLKLDVKQAKDNLASIKRKLDDPNLTKERRAKLNADKRAAEEKLANANRALNAFNRKKASARIDAKSAVEAAVRAARAALNGLNGKTATTYVKTTYIIPTGPTGKPLMSASGGPVSGPGSGTSDDVPIMASNGEYVVKASSVQKYGRAFLDAVNQGTLRAFAKGGKVSKAEQDARGQLRDAFGISHFGTIAGYQRSPFEKALGAPADLGSLVSALNQFRGLIKQATHGGTERSLLRQLDAAGRALIKHERALAKVNAALDKAKDKLSDLKNAAAQLRDSVKSNIISSGNITNAAQAGEGHVTVAGVMGGLKASRDKAKAFADALKALEKKGLSKEAIAQIAQAGIEGGGLETAEALMGASSSEIKSMNDMQAQIAKAAGSAGKTTADAFYGAAIKAQESLVKGLQKQQDKLEKAMEKLAKAIEKVIQKAIGGKASGGIIGAASGGVRGALTWVGEQGPELVRLPYGSTVYPNGQSRRMAAAPVAAGSAGQPMVIQLNIAGRSFGDLIVDTARREIRTRGGNVQAVLGQ